MSCFFASAALEEPLRLRILVQFHHLHPAEFSGNTQSQLREQIGHERLLEFALGTIDSTLSAAGDG